jgi:hypothetical protein
LYTKLRYSSAISYRVSCSGSWSRPCARAAVSLHEVTMFWGGNVSTCMQLKFCNQVLSAYPGNSSVGQVVQRRKAFRQAERGLKCSRSSYSKGQGVCHCGHGRDDLGRVSH